MLLVGLAGETPQLQSCTIRALIFNMKQTIQVDSLSLKSRRKNEDDDNNSPAENNDGKLSQAEKLLSTDA